MLLKTLVAYKSVKVANVAGAPRRTASCLRGRIGWVPQLHSVATSSLLEKSRTTNFRSLQCSDPSLLWSLGVSQLVGVLSKHQSLQHREAAALAPSAHHSGDEGSVIWEV